MYKILKKDCSYLIIEQKACKRTVFEDGTPYFISIPKIIFKIQYFSVGDLFFARCFKGFFCGKKHLYHMPFFNVYSDGSICLGQEKPYCKSLEELTQKIIEKFWNTNFYYEQPSAISWAKYKIKNKSLASLQKWQERTKRNKNWVPSRRDLIKSLRSKKSLMNQKERL